MTASRGLFVKQSGVGAEAVGTEPVEARRALAGLIYEQSPGVPRSGILEQSVTNLVTGSSTMSFNIGACHVVINRAANEGVYIFSLFGTTNVPTEVAPGTDARIDLIYVKQRDVEKTDLNNLPEVGVVKGVPAASPVAPTASLPAGAYVLAEAFIPAGVTSTNNAQVIITQRWRHTALRGTPVLVRTFADLSDITPHTHSQARVMDTNQMFTWDGNSWETESVREHAEFYFSNLDLVSGQVKDIGFPIRDNLRSENSGFVNFNQSGRIAVNKPGTYAVTLHVESLTGFGSGTAFIAFIHQEPGQPEETLHTMNILEGAGGATLSAANIYQKPGTPNPGASIITRIYQSSGITRRCSGRVKITKIT